MKLPLPVIVIGALILVGVTVGMVGLYAHAQHSRDFGPRSPQWIAIPTNAASRDTRILDAAVADLLTNPELAHTREFYGGPSIKTIVYGGFPANYKPTVTGYAFEPLSRTEGDNSRPKQLVVGLAGYWIDQPPTTHTLASSFFAPLTNGLVLTVWNAGGGTIGSAWVSYEVRRGPEGWKLQYSNYVDP